MWRARPDLRRPKSRTLERPDAQTGRHLKWHPSFAMWAKEPLKLADVSRAVQAANRVQRDGCAAPP
jgi:hypothetical protein